MESSKFVNLEPVECDREPIHIPGCIQPHGLLFVLQEPDLKILQVSQNIKDFLGLSSEQVLNQPLSKILSKSQIQKINHYCTQANLDTIHSFELKLKARDTSSQSTPSASIQKFHAILHRNPDQVLILELEPYLLQEYQTSLEIYHLLQGFMLSLRQVETLADFAQLLAAEVRNINQFDRVMVYRFDPGDQSGEVIAEAKLEQLESYLGLHYPASDIPQKARTFYFKNWIRIIPDVDYPPSPLVPTHHPLNQTPLDLSRAVLRSVFPGHLEYLRNMGVRGSMSISIVNENRLWGLITCLNYTPRYVDYQTRKICEFLGQFASVELLRQQELENARYQIQVQSIQESLRKAFAADVDFVQQVLEFNQEKLLDLVCAQGAAILLNDQLTLIGQTPSEEEILDLLDWFLQQEPQELFFTDALSQCYPPSQRFRAQASGVAIASIWIKQTSHHILWFRPEQIYTVNWGGASQNPIIVTESGERRYTPRTSFSLWQETVRGKSLPWQPLERDAAKALREILLQALLDASQAALDRSIALERAATEAMIANRAKSQFLAKMSHELRTPLTAILGFSRLLTRDHTLSDTHKEHLDIISRSGEHLLSLINDVLEMSKIESGQVTLTERPFDLYRLLYSLRDMFAFKALNKDLEFKLEFDPKLPQYVYGDEGKLRQILLNLISNAIKFTPAGSITVRSWATPKEPKASQAENVWRFEFEVSDTGIGIEPDDLEVIFETFRQTDQGRFLQGSGLGLSISRQFAGLMGGDVTAQSVLGQGSTFLCQVQLAKVASTSVLSAQETQLVIGLQPGQPSYRILVVDDILETCQLITNLMEAVGLEVRSVQDGLAAIALCQEWHPDLIWMDVRMPGIDGHETTRQIKALPAGARIKIIALTASAFEEDRLASLSAGCDDFVAKPFTENNLFEKMALHLGLKYIFAEIDSEHLGPPTHAGRMTPLTPSDLQDMGIDWIAAMHRAALLLDENRLHELIDQMPVKSIAIAQRLRDWVRQLQFEAILELTQTRQI